MDSIAIANATLAILARGCPDCDKEEKKPLLERNAGDIKGYYVVIIILSGLIVVIAIAWFYFLYYQRKQIRRRGP